MSQNKFPEEQAGPSEVPPETGFSRPIDQKRAARRRILGAALGAPLIYTLPVGAQGARTSQECELNDDNFKIQAERPEGYELWEGKEGEEDAEWLTQSCYNSFQALTSVDSANKLV